MKIVLTPEDQQLCKRIAKERQENDQRAGVKEQFIGKGDRNKANLDGFGAELAFCRLFNCQPDLNTQPRQGSFDTMLPDGRTVDVKNTTLPWLIVKRTKKVQDSDLFALMKGEFPAYEFMGWIGAERLLVPENLKSWGYGQGTEAYSVPEEKLVIE